MSKSIKAGIVVSLLMMSCLPETATAAYLAPNTSLVDGIRVQAPTRVQAGKAFQVKLISRRSKFQSGICWWSWYSTKGFADAPAFTMSNGIATTKAVPIQPGSGELSFECGRDIRDPKIGGSVQIYIAP